MNASGSAILGVCLVWAAVLLAVAFALRGTPHSTQVIILIGGGVAVTLIILGATRRKKSAGGG